MGCIVTDNFRKKNLWNSLCNGFYLTGLWGERSFATDHVTELAFLSLLNEIYSPSAVQLHKLEPVKSCQSPVYQGGAGYRESARHETLQRMARVPGATKM